MKIKVEQTESTNTIKVNRIKPEDIFNENNTMWSWDEDEYGHRKQYLQYTGDIEELCEEYNISESMAFDLLVEYEEMSKDLIETEREIAEARKGQY